MNNLQVFNNPAFGSVRTLTENGKTLFCGADIAKPLAYTRPSEAVARHCKGTLKRRILTNGGEQEMLFITEGDVYRLIARSRLPEAQKFESWIFDEVVPSIRKHGAYMTPSVLEAALLNPDTLIKLAQELKRERAEKEALQAKIDADAPKVLYADTVAGSKTGMLIREFCKFLRDKGKEIGEKRMFADLRERGFLIKAEGRDRNKPTQRAMEMGLFTVKETAVAKPDGETITRTTPLLTGKGRQYFANLYLAEAVKE